MSGADTLRKGYHDLLRRDILALIPVNAKQVLDLGCGAGNLGQALKKRQHCTVHGIELSKGAATIAAKNLDHVWCDNLNRFDPKFINQKYDTLIFADILEHLISPWRTLKKFTDVLASNGTVIASIPNVAHPWIRNNLAKGVFRYEPAGILDITHLRFFTKTSIFQLFYTAGLKITNITPHPNPQNPIQYHITAMKPPVADVKPLATILMLTFNGWEYTRKALDSIKRKTKTPFKVLVIDNGSKDDTVNELRKDTTIFHIENCCNLGFSKGFNLGLMLLDTPYFVLANNDILVTHYWLAHMIAHIKKDKDLAILGARSNYVSGPAMIPNTPYKDETGLDRFALSLQTKDTNPLTYHKRIVFFFTLFDATIIKKIGFLDEIFGLGNYEDDDYCLRANKANIRTAFDNTVFIHHYGSICHKQNNIAHKTLMLENKKKFLVKHHLTEYGPRLEGE